MTHRNRLIQLIHVGKRELALDDDVYRLLLKATTSKTSCKEMKIEELERVLGIFRAKGFQQGFIPKKRIPAQKAKAKEAKKIQVIWIKMAQQGFIKDGSPQALDSYVKRMTTKLNGVGVAKLEWLDSKLAGHVLECLKRWHYRATMEANHK